MFLINSRFSLVSAALKRSPPLGWFTPQAPLLPKLRGQFAEFLNYDSLDRLGILYLTTCVGLGYGRYHTCRRGFSWQHRITNYPNNGSPSHLTPREPRICLRLGPHAWPGTTIAQDWLPSCVTPVNTLTHTGSGRNPHPRCPTEVKQHKQRSLSITHTSIERCHTGTRISTGYPSTTPVGLALGPD